MPINKIVKSKRSIASIATAVALAAAGGWNSMKDTTPDTLPPAVILATDALITPWEGLVLKSHWDKFAKIWDICYGQTRINGKPVTSGMSFTKAQCQVIAREQIFHDYYMPLVKRIRGFENMPVSVQAAMISGAYNFGVAGMVGSRAASFHLAGYSIQLQADAARAAANKALKDNDEVLARRNAAAANRLYVESAVEYRKGCEAQTAWNKAGGQVVRGLVNRREMGDAQRQGEAELCVSGL